MATTFYQITASGYSWDDPAIIPDGYNGDHIKLGDNDSNDIRSSIVFYSLPFSSADIIESGFLSLQQRGAGTETILNNIVCLYQTPTFLPINDTQMDAQENIAADMVSSGMQFLAFDKTGTADNAWYTTDNIAPLINDFIQSPHYSGNINFFFINDNTITDEQLFFDNISLNIAVSSVSLTYSYPEDIELLTNTDYSLLSIGEIYFDSYGQDLPCHVVQTSGWQHIDEGVDKTSLSDYIICSGNGVDGIPPHFVQLKYWAEPASFSNRLRIRCLVDIPSGNYDGGSNDIYYPCIPEFSGYTGNIINPDSAVCNISYSGNWNLKTYNTDDPQGLLFDPPITGDIHRNKYYIPTSGYLLDNPDLYVFEWDYSTVDDAPNFGYTPVDIDRSGYIIHNFYTSLNGSALDSFIKYHSFEVISYGTVPSKTSGVALYISGYETSNSGVDLFVRGAPNETLDLLLEGHDVSNSGIDLVLRGAGSNDSIDLYMNAFDPLAGMNLYMHGPQWNNKSGITTLYMSGIPFPFISSGVDLYLENDRDSDLYDMYKINLSIPNVYNVDNSGISLYVLGGVNNYSDLFIQGAISNSGNVDLFLTSFLTDASGVDLSMSGIGQARHMNLYLQAEEYTDFSSGVDLWAWGTANSGLFSSVDLSIPNVGNNPSGSLNLFLPNTEIANYSSQFNLMSYNQDSLGSFNSGISLYIQNERDAISYIGDEVIWLCPTLDIDAYDTNVLTDLTNNGHSGVLIGGASWVSDSDEQGVYAIETNGTNGYIDLGNSLGIPSGDMSISIWFNILANSLSAMAISSRETTFTEIRVRNLTLQPEFILNHTPENNVAEDTNPITVSGWNHVAGTYNDTTKIMKLYVNGVFVDDNAVGTMRDHNSFTIGRRDSGGFYMKGRFDDIRIFNRTLTDAEVASLSEYRGFQYPSYYGSVPLYTRSIENNSSSMNLYLERGANLHTEDLDMFISGPVGNSGIVPLFLEGLPNHNDSIDLYMSGHVEYNQNMILYTHGF